MIKQSIEKYKDEYSYGRRVYHGNSPYQQQQQVTRPPHIPVNVSPFAKMEKLAYANYISKLTLKKGDLVCMKTALKPLTDWNIYELTDIQEIHYLCDNGGPNIGPMCLRLRAHNGNCFNGGGEQYVRVEHGELTSAWRTFLQARWAASNDSATVWDI